MGGRISTLGYRSRTDAVLALRAQHLTTAVIAARIGLEPKTVLALEASRRRSKRRAQSNRTVLFPLDLLDRLATHAARRGISPNELARRIVDTVLDERLVDAVLDDAVPTKEAGCDPVRNR